jgi:membrane-bound lytic murein transglycosylase MltF
MTNLRSKAEAEGYDPNVWFDNVELIAANEIGRETV